MNMSFISYQTEKLAPQRIMVKIHKGQTSSHPLSLASSSILGEMVKKRKVVSIKMISVYVVFFSLQ